MLGGAVGDALGYTVEFMSMGDLREKYGNRGVRELEIDGTIGKAMISDDTQLTAFTADGLIGADNRAREKGVYAYTQSIFYAYQMWYYTQTGHFSDENYAHLSKQGQIHRWKELYERRVPSPTCLLALEGSTDGKYGTLKNSINNKKGNGGVKRAAPIGLYFYDDPKKAFLIGCESAALTYGHPDGILPAGFFSCLIANLVQGKKMENAAEAALKELEEWPDSRTTSSLVEKALSLSKRSTSPYEGIIELGEGRSGEEALAMGLFSALVHQDNFQDAVCVAVNHGGDSDCIGSICGNIMGTYLGSLEIPYNWIHNVELDDLMVMLADQLLECRITKGEK